MHVANPTNQPTDIWAYTLNPTRLEMLKRPTNLERAMLSLHWVYMQQLLDQGVIVFSGRALVTNQDSFSIAVIKSPSEELARKVMEEDPAVKGGVFRGRLFPFLPLMMGEWPQR